MVNILKDVKYYVTGFTALGLFIYLLNIGQNELALRLFDSLTLILAFVFGFNTKK